MTMPTEVSSDQSLFDRFAGTVNALVSRAWFFLACLIVVLIWAPSYFLFTDKDTWQLIINTLTTIVTFLLVALLQNTQKRSDDSNHHKLNAIAQALYEIVESSEVRKQLIEAVGLEDREGSI